MSKSKTTHVTVRFTVHDDDVAMVAANMTGSVTDNPATNLSYLLQDMMYDDDNGPQLEGEYVITGVEEG